MFGIVFKLFGIATALVLVIYMAANAFRSARHLDRRIREFKVEQEALQQNGPINPYAVLAELYADDSHQNEIATRRPTQKRR